MKNTLLIFLLFITTDIHAQTYTTAQYKEDFNFFWTTMNDNYAYFENKGIDWNKLKSVYSSQVDTVQSRQAFVGVLEKAIYELYDHHCGLRTNTPHSRRLVPTSTDIWADYTDGKPIIREVRKGFGAEKVGITAGMEVIAINDKPVDQAIIPFLAHNNSVEAKSFALRLAIAGDHVTQRKISLKINHKVSNYFPDQNGMMLEDIQFSDKAVAKTFGQTGYIQINNFLFDNSLIPAFDSVLNTLMSTKALIIDLRETASGGHAAVARAILGRFITKEQFFQKHELVAEEKETGIKRSWEEIVSPRDKPYLNPLVILVDHWTGSVSEGLTIGFDGMKRATIIGTRMAALNGAVESVDLPNTKIGFNLTTERLFHINGQPREFYKPTIEVDVTNQKLGDGGDLILNAALLFLKKRNS